MKKILSFVLAIMMIASMAAVAFAEEGATTTPTATTIYDAADFAARDDVILTPDNLAGYTGFNEMTLKIDEELPAVAEGTAQSDKVVDFWTSDKLKSGDTLFVYYYVAENTGAQIMIYLRGATQRFQVIDPTPGYHMAEIHLDADYSVAAMYFKHTDAAAAKSVEVYVGGAEVMEGAVYAPLYMDAESLAYTAKDAKPGDNYFTPDFAGGGGIGRVAKLNAIGYTVTGEFTVYYRYISNFHNSLLWMSSSNGLTTVDSGWNWTPTQWQFAKGYDATSMTINPDASEDTWFSFHVAYMLDPNVNPNVDNWQYDIESIIVVPKNVSNYYITAESMALVSQSEDWVIENAADNDLYTGNMPANTQFTIDYDVKLATGALYIHNSDNVTYNNFYPLDNTVGNHVVTHTIVENSVFYRLHSSPGGSTVQINSMKIGNVKTLASWSPIELLGAEKIALYDTVEVNYDFNKDKAYMVEIDYRAFVDGDAPTITLGNKKVTLKAGDNTAKIAVIGGATKIVFDAPEAVVLIGDITFEEVGEEYGAFIDEFEKFVASTKLDKTLAQTPEGAKAYVENLIEKSGKYVVTDITYVADSFVPYAEDATVATASAATNGSVSFVVAFEETDARGFTYSDTFTFEIVKGEISKYNAATGDSIIVAVVALVAVITLAGVVIAKKKVASK